MSYFGESRAEIDAQSTVNREAAGHLSEYLLAKMPLASKSAVVMQQSALRSVHIFNYFPSDDLAPAFVGLTHCHNNL